MGIFGSIISGVGSYAKDVVATAKEEWKPEKLKESLSLGSFISSVKGGIEPYLATLKVSPLGFGISKVVGATVSKAVPKALPVVVKALPSVAKAVVKVLPKTPAGILKATVLTGVVAGGGLSILPKVYGTTKALTESTLPILMGEEKLTKEKAGDVAKLVGIGLGLGAVGVAGAYAVDKLLNKAGEKVLSPAVEPKVQITPQKVLETDTSVPLARETQKITVGTKKRRAVKRKEPQIVNLIQNRQNVYIGS